MKTAMTKEEIERGSVDPPPRMIGVIAATWLTAAMFGHRLFFGIASVPGLITERIIPLVPGAASGDILGIIDQFAKLIPELAAIGGQILVGAAVAGWYARTWGRSDAPAWKRWAFGPLVGLGLWAVTLAALWPVLPENYQGRTLATGRALSVIAILCDYLLFGVLLPVLSMLARRQRPDEATTDEDDTAIVSRRAIVVAGASAVSALSALTLGLGRISTFGYDGSRPKRPVRPITDNVTFYSVTKNLADPQIGDTAVWQLAIDGAVAHPMTLSFADLKELPATDETVTLACIGNTLGGGLISTAAWHGVPLQTLIDRAKPALGVTEVLFTASDGYTNTIALDSVAAEGVMVAYGMNGEPLPEKHGYPVRIIAPGRYGEKHVKWVTQITLQAHHTAGFYASQGWDNDAVVKTIARIDYPVKGATVARGQPITVTGIAFGGLRGVSNIEATTDGGKTWQHATITATPSPQSWVLWDFPWIPPAQGDYTLAVRCYDGVGTLQPTNVEPNFPSGAAGLQFITVTAR